MRGLLLALVIPGSYNGLEGKAKENQQVDVAAIKADTYPTAPSHGDSFQGLDRVLLLDITNVW
mgnify:CR=1 FL=1